MAALPAARRRRRRRRLLAHHGALFGQQVGVVQSSGVSVWHEAIYTPICALPAGERRRELIGCLRQGKPQGSEPRGKLCNMTNIKERPEEIEGRLVPGLRAGDNGLLRQYFPKSTPLSGFDQADLDRAADSPNGRRGHPAPSQRRERSSPCCWPRRPEITKRPIGCSLRNLNRAKTNTFSIPAATRHNSPPALSSPPASR
jgi:hypothetical protein